MPARCRQPNKPGLDSVGRVALKVTLPAAVISLIVHPLDFAGFQTSEVLETSEISRETHQSLISNLFVARR